MQNAIPFVEDGAIASDKNGVKLAQLDCNGC